jgi:hypothetical protein
LILTPQELAMESFTPKKQKAEDVSPALFLAEILF